MKTMVRKPWMVGTMTFVMAAGILSPSYAILDKTRFAVHLGLGFGAFHHWVWKPYKQGMFASGAPHRTKALIKGGLALLFAVHELKVSDDIAHKSNSPLLHKLVSPLDALQAEYTTLGQKLKGGQFNPSDLEALNTHVGALGAGAAAAGAPVKDADSKIPGTDDSGN